jgi:hypothetical protein
MVNDMLVNSSSAFDIVAALIHKEKTHYNDKVDFLAHAENKGIRVQIDQECRRKMAQLCYDVCETYQMSTEVAEVAMNMLDRYMVTPAGETAFGKRFSYQLACMTCLYTAIEAHESKVLDPEMVSFLSGGMYSTRDIEQMESNILTALQYRVHPPTPTSFVRSYLDVLTTTASVMIPSLLNPLHQKKVMEVSEDQLQEAVSSYHFVTTPASVIGYCCLINSLETLGLLDDVNARTGVKWFLSQFLSDVSAADVSEYSRLLFSAISGKYSKLPMSHEPRKGSKKLKKLLFRIKQHRKGLKMIVIK